MFINFSLLFKSCYSKVAVHHCSISSNNHVIDYRRSDMLGDVLRVRTGTSLPRVLGTLGSVGILMFSSFVDGPEHHACKAILPHVFDDLKINVETFPNTVDGLMPWFEAHDDLRSAHMFGSKFENLLVRGKIKE